MRATACAAAVLLLATACSGGSSGSKAGPSPTPVTTSPPAATAPATPSATPTASATAAATHAPTGPAGTAVPKGFTPSSASFISDQTGWVLGSSPCPSGAGRCDVITRTRDAGRSWRAIPSPRTSPDRLGELRFADALNGFVTGNQLWATHDGGARWTVVAGHPDVSELEAASGRVWVLKQGTLQSATTAGGGFVPERAPAGAAGLVLHGSDVFVSKDSSSSVFRGRHSSAFVAVGTPCPKETSVSLGLASSSRWLAVCAGDGGLGHQQKTAFRTTDAGRTWRAAGAPPPLSGTTVSLTTDGDFVADNQAVSVSRDGDASWHTSLGSDGGLTGSGFESARLGFAIGGFTGSTDLAMRITRDAGRHWSPVAF